MASGQEPMQNGQPMMTSRAVPAQAPQVPSSSGLNGTNGPNAHQEKRLRARGSQQITHPRPRLQLRDDPFITCASCRKQLCGYLTDNEAKEMTMILSCGHAICPHCTYKWKTEHSEPANKTSMFQCKKCAQYVHERPLPSLTEAMDRACESPSCTFRDRFPAVSYCNTCRIRFCSPCVNNHSKAAEAAGQKHNVVQLPGRNGPTGESFSSRFIRCTAHNLTLKYRCSCGELHCEKCSAEGLLPTTLPDGTKVKHEWVPIEATDMVIEDAFQSSAGIALKINEQIKKMVDLKTEVKDQSDRLANEICVHLNQMMLMCSIRAYDMIQNIKKHADAHDKKLAAMKEKLEVVRRRMHVGLEMDERTRDRESLTNEHAASVFRAISYSLLGPIGPGGSVLKYDTVIKQAQEFADNKYILRCDFNTIDIMEAIAAWGTITEVKKSGESTMIDGQKTHISLRTFDGDNLPDFDVTGHVQMGNLKARDYGGKVHNMHLEDMMNRGKRRAESTAAKQAALQMGMNGGAHPNGLHHAPFHPSQHQMQAPQRPPANNQMSAAQLALMQQQQLQRQMNAQRMRPQNAVTNANPAASPVLQHQQMLRPAAPPPPPPTQQRPAIIPPNVHAVHGKVAAAPPDPTQPTSLESLLTAPTPQQRAQVQQAYIQQQQQQKAQLAARIAQQPMIQKMAQPPPVAPPRPPQNYPPAHGVPQPPPVQGRPIAPVVAQPGPPRPLRHPLTSSPLYTDGIVPPGMTVQGAATAGQPKAQMVATSLLQPPPPKQPRVSPSTPHAANHQDAQGKKEKSMSSRALQKVEEAARMPEIEKKVNQILQAAAAETSRAPLASPPPPPAQSSPTRPPASSPTRPAAPPVARPTMVLIVPAPRTQPPVPAHPPSVTSPPPPPSANPSLKLKLSLTPGGHPVVKPADAPPQVATPPATALPPAIHTVQPAPAPPPSVERTGRPAKREKRMRKEVEGREQRVPKELVGKAVTEPTYDDPASSRSSSVEMDTDGSHTFCLVCRDKPAAKHEGKEKGCCAKCPRVYHTKCHSPNVIGLFSETPDDWQCSYCCDVEPYNNTSGALDEKAAMCMAKIVLQCYTCNRNAIFFHEKVKERDAPGYYEKIKHPMWLERINQRVTNTFYSFQGRADNACPEEVLYLTMQEFINDMNLIFENCFNYNKPGCPVIAASKSVFYRYRQAVSKYIPSYLSKVWDMDQATAEQASLLRSDKQALKRKSEAADTPPPNSSTAPPAPKRTSLAGRPPARNDGASSSAFTEDESKQK